MKKIYRLEFNFFAKSILFSSSRRFQMPLEGLSFVKNGVNIWNFYPIHQLLQNLTITRSLTHFFLFAIFNYKPL